MSELDDRVTRGLRDLVDGAPVDAEVWDETGRYVVKHRRRRQAAFASASLAIVAAVGIGVAVAANAAHSPRRQVKVAQGPTGPVPAFVTPSTVPATTPRTTPPVTAAPRTTTATTTVPVALPDACPSQCVGRGEADVDGDGRADHIGLMETKKSTANTPTGAIKIRVVFATGAVAEFDDTEGLFSQWLGVADVNGDGKAEIFYMNSPGAHSYTGNILRWDGAKLVYVNDDHGRKFFWFTDSALFYDSGFRCSGDTMVFTSYQYQGTGDGTTGPWTGNEQTYSWRGGNLVQSSTKQLTAEGRTTPDEAYGAHCQGLPRSTSSLLQP